MSESCKAPDCKHIASFDVDFCKETHLKLWRESPERSEVDWADETHHSYDLAVANFCLRLRFVDPTE